MRRRRIAPNTHVPPELVTFNPTDWDPDEQVAVHKWSRARMAYYNLHPDAWPNPLAVLAGYANVRSRLAGKPPLYPEYDMGRHQ